MLSVVSIRYPLITLCLCCLSSASGSH